MPIKLHGKWTKIDASETTWQCEYGADKWDLSCKTCYQSPNKSSRSGVMNRAHWRNLSGSNEGNYLCNFHYEMLNKPPPPSVELEWPAADEFARGLNR